MYKVFNMGIGMVLAVDRKDALKSVKILAKENARVIGKIVKGNQKVIIL